MIKLIVVGKMKEKAMSQLCDDYQKRINHFFNLELVELKEANSKFEDSKIIESEGQDILKQIVPSDFVVTLDLKGKMIDSPKFADWLQSWIDEGKKIVFVIGGSLGLSELVKQRANASLCLSKMTFTHLLARLILLEQLFRCFKINANQNYHK